MHGLSRKELNENPFKQFELWFNEAIASGIAEPNAFALATAAENGQPSLRTVLLKVFDEDGFVFYTNFESKKAIEMDGNPMVSMLFPWLDLQRQVKISGRVQKISTSESLKYFLSRPRGSQIGAWTSQQSSVVSTRSLLLAKFDEMKRKFDDKEVPLPSFWGGYRIVPSSIEFWQGRENRLHDRFLFSNIEGEWKIERLAP